MNGMVSELDTTCKLERNLASDIEVGWYPCGDNSILLYANQHGLCIGRVRLSLIAELTRGEPVSVATREHLAGLINIDLRLKQPACGSQGGAHA